MAEFADSLAQFGAAEAIGTVVSLSAGGRSQGLRGSSKQRCPTTQEVVP
jgi:hypothetical protein